jgi:acetoin utilization deacetylase AcuC-like enzyme
MQHDEPHVISPAMGTLIGTDLQGVMVFQCSASDAHDTGDHQETMLRTELLCGPEGCLRRDILKDFVTFVPDDPLCDGHGHGAEMADLLRVHDLDYLEHLVQKCSMAGGSYDCSRTRQPSFYAPAGKLDCDTPLTAQSLEASRKFCGAAILAMDTVMADWDPSATSATSASGSEEARRAKRAFVVGRPPGHHAGPSGCVVSEHFWRRPDMASSGFCLLNTVAVAAAYTMYNYGRERARLGALRSLRTGSVRDAASSRPPRVAIVDIDVHHGNGTEEIVRNVVPGEQSLPLPSSWAPVSRKTHKPWRTANDSENILFGSINLHAAERFYPGAGADGDTGARSSSSSSSSDGGGGPRIINVALTPIGPGPWDLKARLKLTVGQRNALCKQAGNELRTKVVEQLLPALQDFQPDVLLMSSGFDSHYNDMYHFLTEGDFHWLTQALCDTTRDGRVVSILEGGYSLESPLPVMAAAAGKKQVATRTTRNSSPDKSARVTAAPPPLPLPAEMLVPPTRFAVMPGDGGLVKGVLAHVAALAGRQEWIEGGKDLMM